MATISLRQALTPTGNWIIVGVHDDQHGEKVNGIMTSVGSWTEVLIYNPGTAPVSVSLEVRNPAGAVVSSDPNIAIAPGATARPQWAGGIDYGTMILRCPQPILPSATRGTGSERVALTVHPLLAG